MRRDNEGGTSAGTHVDQITGAIIGAAIEVHRALGPGLLESAYRACLVYELRRRGWLVEPEKPLPVTYKGVELDCGYRLDLVVQDTVIVELKAVEEVIPIHQAQLLSYLRLAGKSVGLLINFNVKVLVDGVDRIVNNHVET
jgi:GxxExxY protein